MVHQHQVADGLLGVFAHGLQQVDEVLGEALDRAGVEQLIGVVECQAQPPITVFFTVQLQVELGFAAVPRQFIGEQARQAAQGTQVALLVVEHDLEQALFTGLREGFEELFKRQVLMSLGPQSGLARCCQQRIEWQSPVQLGAQH